MVSGPRSGQGERADPRKPLVLQHTRSQVLGVVFRPQLPPERLRAVAEAAEAAGVAQLWLWEDSFFEGGIASAAAALAWTSRLQVGIGLLPVPLRNPALTAMEIATVARLFPGRFLPGLGHGVLEWMAQAGAAVASPMTLLREYTAAVRALLAGERVSDRGPLRPARRRGAGLAAGEPATAVRRRRTARRPSGWPPSWATACCSTRSPRSTPCATPARGRRGPRRPPVPGGAEPAGGRRRARCRTGSRRPRRRAPTWSCWSRPRTLPTRSR